MGTLDVIFGEDIVLDEAAFDKAIEEFAVLGVKLQTLRTEITTMLDILKAGFDTPAGRKFLASCEENLYQPLDAQKIVLDHISRTLRDAKTAYSSVFQEYEALQTAIKQRKT